MRRIQFAQRRPEAARLDNQFAPCIGEHHAAGVATFKQPNAGDCLDLGDRSGNRRRSDAEGVRGSRDCLVQRNHGHVAELAHGQSRQQPVVGSIGGSDLPDRHGNDNWLIPLPASFVVDRCGIVRYAFAAIDFTYRAEPDAIVGALGSLE